MASLFKALLLALLSCLASLAEACNCSHADFVKFLPGFNAPLPSPWFSGYLYYEMNGQQVHTHYTLIAAENDWDEDNPKPLIYWSNGGPGASSMFGLLTELGPLLLSDLSLQTEDYRATGIPTPIYNPFTWARLGTLLAFDQPAPVGFSYCNNDTDSHSCGGIAWTDELTSMNAYKALQAFYNKFPCYKQHDLYLTGESYAGIYIPTLARRILQDESAAKITTLKGFAVGDGCLGTKTGICGVLNDDPRASQLWDMLFLAGHGQLPRKTFKNIMQACHQHLSDARHAKLSDACGDVLAEAYEQAGGFFEYGLYDDCTYRNGLLKGGLNDYACGGGVVMLNYLNMSQVKEALHVRGSFFETDNAEGDFDYTPTEPDLTVFYKEINGKLRVLVYNGDADPAINSFAAENWTSSLGFSELEKFRPWTIDGCLRMGGYVTRYGGDFDYLTVRGAGHLVPLNKAAASFAFFKSWISNEEYPRYNKDCQKWMGLKLGSSPNWSKAIGR
jgi:serine carboxypeptidase-like clade 1